MCGIVGILARNAAVPQELLDKATRSLAHRGPDDHGTVLLQQAHPEPIALGLGNRRLSILDLSPLGHQPMHDEETGNWIVYNGEVYNFRELRSRLESQGARFRSNSDTEVILKAYGFFGDSFLKELRGMFAVAIWDARRRRLLLARDPMGIKPLYFYKSDGHFLFASELRTLLTTGLVPRKMDASAVWNYLRFGSVYEPDTLIEGVSALAPGSSLSWENGALTAHRYFNLLPSHESNFATGRNRMQLQEQVHATLEEAVRMQLVSDVPVGVFLSGGIDSSILVGILRRAGVQPSTFSIVFREQEFSEAEHSRAVARSFNTDHHEITVSQKDVLEILPAALRAMDQPTMDGINTYFVSERTRAGGVKVALSGLGGDELFGGYASFQAVPRMERFKNFWSHLPGVVRGTAAATLAALAPASDQNRKLSTLIQGNGRLIHPYFLSRMLFSQQQRMGLAPRTSESERQRADVPLRTSVEETQALDPINRVSYLESRCYMLNTLLRDSDFMSMAHGLEVRVPMIDDQLARQILALPGNWKTGGSSPKPMLVGALGDALPRSIVQRPKRGFTLPFEQWMREALRPEVESSLSKIGDGALNDFVDGAAARAIWQSFLRGETSWSRPWSLFVLNGWCQHNL